jgi:integrase/recombinase XerD
MYPELTQFQNWLACQYPHSSVRKHYKSDLALFFSYADKPPSAIRFQEVDEYIHYCLSKRLSPLTINRRLSSLRTFYYFLSIVNNVSVPCPVIPERHFLRKPQPLPRDASEEQIRILFAKIHNPRDHAMFTLMLECGLRVGEVHNHSLEDVFSEGSPRLRIYGKGDQHRIAYLPPPAWEALQDWLTSRPVQKDRAVFISERGKRLSVSGIQFILKGYCRKAGVHVTCHQFRHTFGRRMAEARLPVTTLQKLFGHRSPRTTQRYVHLLNPFLHDEYDRAIARVLGSLA